MDEPVELRFRNQTSDGRVAASEVVRLERAVPPPARLGQPGFGHAAYRPGDLASVFVAAEGVQRGSITFIIEKQAGGAWQPAATLSAPFVGGQASARWPVPDQPDATAAQYRVRAVAPFGESAGDPCTVEGSPQLTDPAFSHAHPSRGSHFDDGDEAVMRVLAKGLDGKQVRFVIEIQQGGSWAPYQSVSAVAENGAATAKVVVRHPALASRPTLSQLKGAKPVQLRFHAELQ